MSPGLAATLLCLFPPSKHCSKVNLRGLSRNKNISTNTTHTLLGAGSFNITPEGNLELFFSLLTV